MNIFWRAVANWLGKLKAPLRGPIREIFPDCLKGAAPGSGYRLLKTVVGPNVRACKIVLHCQYFLGKWIDLSPAIRTSTDKRRATIVARYDFVVILTGRSVFNLLSTEIAQILDFVRPFTNDSLVPTGQLVDLRNDHECSVGRKSAYVCKVHFAPFGFSWHRAMNKHIITYYLI